MTDLLPEWRVGSVVLTDAPFAVVRDSSVDYGAPETVSELVRSLLTDGDLELSSRTGNRTVVLPVLIDDSDLVALADAEAALVAECDKPLNEVYVDPGDGFAAPFIYDVFRGQLTLTRNDDYERAGYRSYSLTFRALPFARSTEETELTPTPVSIGTARQQSYEFTVGGSARTEAAIEVAGASTLGNTLIYTGPAFIPLRQYRVAGTTGTTVAAGNVSGRYDDDINFSPFEALVPKDEVPDGTYIILARPATASGSGTTTLTTTYATEIAGNSLRSAEMFDVDVDLTTTYGLVQLGTPFQLPSALVVDEASADIFISIADAAAGVTVRLDEAWLVEIGTGALTWPDTLGGGFGTPAAQYVWVDPATTARPYRRVLRGAASDQSDAFAADVFSWGTHTLEPGTNTAFLMTDDDTAAVLTLRFFDRWHTHRGS